MPYKKTQKILKNRRLWEGVALLLLLAIYGWFFFHKWAMLPDPNDPLEYIEPSVWKTFMGGYYPWPDRLMIADGIRFLSLFFRPELAGEIYFGLISFSIAIVAIIWAYLKKGFWAAYLVGLFLIISYPLVRYANYGYPDATVALFGLCAAIFYLRSQKTQGSLYLAGIFTGLAIFSKITGLAFLLFFVVDLIVSKKYAYLKPYFVGLITASAFVLVATGLLFDWASVSYAIKSFGTDISSNTEPRAVLRSIGNILWPEISLPAYLALIVFIGAYKDKLIKKLFLISWTFIGFFLALFIFSSHVKVYPHYLYSAYLFASIGMALYLADLTARFKNKYFFSLVSLILVFLGFSLGIRQSNDFDGLKIYYDGLSHYAAPLWLKISYVAFALLIISLMIAIGKLRQSRLAIVFLVMTSFLGSYFVAGSAMNTIRAQKDAAKVIYAYAQALGEIPKAQTVIFSNVIDNNNFPKVLWVYRLFIDQKYNRSSRIINQQEVENDIKQVDKQDIGHVEWSYIITDNPSAVQTFFPDVKEVKESSNQIYILTKNVPKS